MSGPVEGDVRFAGYAAIFDRVDRGGDVVRRGAFDGAVATRVPLLGSMDRAASSDRLSDCKRTGAGCA